jgi:hypothetical protein
MDYTPLAVASLLGQVQAAILVAGELCTQLDQLKHTGWTLTADDFNSPVAGGMADAASQTLVELNLVVPGEAEQQLLWCYQMKYSTPSKTSPTKIT